MISPLYGSISPLRVPTKQRKLADSNAITYIAAVEAADGAKLEDTVRFAYEDFILGCKSDGTWNAIKASCILAGARTLAGALVPLVGPAPTNLNFVSADYNRKTGLLGNGSTKILNTNVAGTSTLIPQDDSHFSVFATTAPSSNTLGAYGGNAGTGSAGLVIFRGNGLSITFTINCTARQSLSVNVLTGFHAANRNSASQFSVRTNNQNTTFQISSVSRPTGNVAIFSRTIAASAPSDGRNSFYSLGGSLDLTALNTRVSTLMSALAAAIP